MALTMISAHEEKDLDRIKIIERSIFSQRDVFLPLLHKEFMIENKTYDVLRKWFDYMKNTVDKPDAIIYVNTHPDICLSRVKSRKMSEEQEIDLRYLKKVEEAHEIWLKEMHEKMNVPIIYLDGNLVLEDDNMKMKEEYERVLDDLIELKFDKSSSIKNKEINKKMFD